MDYKTTDTMVEKLNRYVMGWSQAYCGWMVVYAECLEDAEAKFENGECTIEEEG